MSRCGHLAELCAGEQDAVIISDDRHFYLHDHPQSFAANRTKLSHLEEVVQYFFVCCKLQEVVTSVTYKTDASSNNSPTYLNLVYILEFRPYSSLLQLFPLFSRGLPLSDLTEGTQ